jgi:hypothetical protein
MKQGKRFVAGLLLIAIMSCNKSNDGTQISLTPSSSQVAVGETLTVNLNTNANASSWTVSPSSTAKQTYGVTTSKVNYFTFSQAGTYSISVTARNVSYISNSQSLTAAWNEAGSPRGGCTHGIDSTSVKVTVTTK